MIHAPLTQNPHNQTLSRIENIPNACGLTKLFYSTQNCDHLVVYQERFSENTGQPNPQ